MITKRAARATPWAGLAGRAGPVAQPLARHKQSTGLFESGARLLGAPEIASAGHRLPRAKVVCGTAENQILPCKGAWALGAARLWGAEERRACGQREARS